MVLKNIQKNRVCLAELQRSGGFVILFAVVLSSILLTITLGVANIALKEVKFSASVKDSNYAFFAADSGIECALFNDKPPTAFPFPYVEPTPIACASTVPVYDAPTSTYSFLVTSLGSTGISCAKVTVLKDGTTNPPNILTTVIAKGYNFGDSSCESVNPDRIEREIKVTY